MILSHTIHHPLYGAYFAKAFKFPKQIQLYLYRSEPWGTCDPGKTCELKPQTTVSKGLNHPDVWLKQDNLTLL